MHGGVMASTNLISRRLMLFNSESNVSGAFSRIMNYIPVVGATLPISFLLMSSILPILKVLLIAATGLVFALPQVGVLHSSARHSLSKLVFTVFLPAIIFVNLGEAISPEKLLDWWFIPVNVVIASVSGCCIGVLVAHLTNTPPEFFRITFVLTGIGNMGNMPLVLLSAVCSDVRNPFGESAFCNTTGTAYVSLGMWTAALIMWGVVYNILAPPEDWLRGYVNPEKLLPGSSGETSHVPVRVKPREEMRDPLLERQLAGGEAPNPSSSHLRRASLSSDLRRASQAVMTSVLESRFHYWMRTLHIYDMLRPPVLAAMLAMVMGMIPALGYQFFDRYGAFRFLTDSIAILGDAMIPCILLVLGGNLVGGPGSSRLPMNTTVAIVLTRLLVVPCVGICVVLMADKLGFLPPDDQLFRFVLFLQHAMPSSIQIGTACSLRGFGDKEVSAVLFYQHLAAVVTMAIFLFVFFFLLFGS